MLYPKPLYPRSLYPGPLYPPVGAATPVDPEPGGRPPRTMWYPGLRTRPLPRIRLRTR